MRQARMSIDRPWLAAGALAALAALYLAMLLFGTGDVDRTVLMALYAGDEPWLALGAIGLSYLGTWPTVVAVTILGAGWLLYSGKRRAALVLLVASFSGRLLVILEKAYFARLRPEESLRMVEVHYQSFPSGHAANSMIAFLSLALLAFDDERQRRWAIGGALLLSFLIGVSRPMLGVHWPSDVIGGWSFGMFWTLLVLGLSSRWGRKAK
jgi:membrane-associated phospholipid phosphatase